MHRSGRGEIVAVCLPERCRSARPRAAATSPAGVCPGGYEPLVKPVAAVAGDRGDGDAGRHCRGRPTGREHTAQLVAG